MTNPHIVYLKHWPVAAHDQPLTEQVITNNTFHRPNKPKNGGITAGISRAGPGRDVGIGAGADSGAEVSQPTFPVIPSIHHWLAAFSPSSKLSGPPEFSSFPDLPPCLSFISRSFFSSYPSPLFHHSSSPMRLI